jgi:HlyD family secretion protein
MNAMLPVPMIANVTLLAETYDERARKRTRIAAMAAGVLLLGTVAGGALVPIGGAVIASAEVAPETRVKRIAHPTGGVISEIFVGDGDTVKQGALLMRLDTSVSAVDAQSSSASLDQLLAQRARLTAELEDRSAIAFPANLFANNSDSARGAAAAEQRRFGLNRAERTNLLAQLRERMNQSRRQIDGYNAQISALQRQQELILPELEMLRSLRAKGYVTIRRLNEMERTAIELEGSIGALQANIAQANAAIAQAQEQQVQVGQSARTQASAELAQVNAAINDQTVASADAGDRLDRSAIRAPNAGTIDKLAFAAIGEVVRPAETIMEIVPQNDRLVFNGLVSPIDIDRVRMGQSTRVRLSAFNQASTPEFDGEVIFVSADPVSDTETGIRFFRVRVALTPASQQTASRLELVSGMPAELFIETGSRSMLSFITKPLMDQFARAFRN